MAESLKIMPVAKVGLVGRLSRHPMHYESEATRWGTPTKQRAANFAIAKLEETWAKDIAQHEENLPALQNNAEIRAHVTALMTAIAMPEKFSTTDPNSRARFPKRHTHEAGWKTDLLRECPVNDGYDYAKGVYERLKTTYIAYAAEGAKEAEAATALKVAADERRRQEKLANVELAEIVLRYSLDREAEWSDVLDALRAKDQRLNLAVAMSQTRSDWNDGPDRVIDALRGFEIETTEDKDIVTDVMPHATDWDGDGRIFRDCGWNYSRLFAEAADQQLSTDIQKAMERSARD